MRCFFFLGNNNAALQPYELLPVGILSQGLQEAIFLSFTSHVFFSTI